MSDDSIKAAKPAQEPKIAKKPLKVDFGNPVKVILLTLAIFLSTQLISALIIGIVSVIVNGNSSVENLFEGSVLLNFIFILLTEALTFLFVFKLIGGLKSQLKKIGLISPQWRDLGYASVGFIGYYAILLVVSIIVYTLIPSIDTDQKQDLGFEDLKNNLELVIAFFSLVILPPLGEEILMRGYLFSGLRYRLKFWVSALIVSVLFAIAHLQLGGSEAPLWAAAINTFVLSMVLVFVREKSGSLWPAIYIHMLNNLVAFIYLFKDNIF